MSEIIIHIQWGGPYSPAALTALDKPSDYGVYAIYGHHPVYGDGALLYIGKAREQTFKVEIPLKGYGRPEGNEDAANIEIYVGRLKGEITPELNRWRKEIDLAEKLLIHANGPAYNTQHILEIAETDPDVRNTRVLSWGCHRAIQPEVSGRRWTKKWTEEANGYAIYAPLTTTPSTDHK